MQHGDDGWVRIGFYDIAERRSLWMREDGKDPPQRIELSSGREGDDAYVSLDASNPQWPDLYDVLLRAITEADDGAVDQCHKLEAELAAERARWAKLLERVQADQAQTWCATYAIELEEFMIRLQTSK